MIVAGDGTRLAATLYLPAGDGPFAAVLEALPYRKDDITDSYRSTYERYAAAGFAVMRLDLRGTGSSERGREPTSTRTSSERTCVPRSAGWRHSSGRRVASACSARRTPGSIRLQMAAAIGELDVPELGAVVATYATDDRYTDDVHYAGGVLRAIDLIDYPLYMVAMNALPPVPAVFGDGWRAEWRRRIDDTPPWLVEWLEASDRRPDLATRLDPARAGRRRVRADGMSDDDHRRVGGRLSQQHVPGDRAVRAQLAPVATARRPVGPQVAGIGTTRAERR